MAVGFDVISDLYLNADESFNWENKPTSLYLIIAGNISEDLLVVRQTLRHLSKLYQGIFYISGFLEHPSIYLANDRYKEISDICGQIRNVAFLYKHVVIINGIAIMGATGWYGNIEKLNTLSHAHLTAQNFDDTSYMSTTLNKLQIHVDVKKIITVTNCVPDPTLYYGELPMNVGDLVVPNTILAKDTENKISHWVYGTYNKPSEKKVDNINYISNGYFKRRPYWPKRIEVDF